MTDPAVSAELARFLGVPGIAEIIVRVVPPGDGWLLDVMAPAERETIQRKYFAEQLSKLKAGLRLTAGIRTTLYPDRGEAAVAGPPGAVYELLRPGGAIERNSLLEVLQRIRFDGSGAA
jgi:hypothetical protein